MDLNELLKKTKKKKEQMGEIPTPLVASIADDDRPYKSSELSPSHKIDPNSDERIGTGRKPSLANREHSVSNAYAEALAMREHSVSKTLANETSKIDSVSNAYAEALAMREQDREHSVSKTLANSDFESLVGKEKNLLILIFSKCQLAGSLESPIIPSEELTQSLQISSERLRNLIYRLIKKNVLKVIQTKNGRSSWRKFCIPQTVFQQLSLSSVVSKPLADREHSVSNASPKAYAEALAEPPSSSRDLFIKKTTTTGDVDNFELTSTQVVEFGITTSAINRCFELYPGIDREKMQDLINRFGQFMRTGEGKRVQNARGFFISLAKQLSEGITPLDHIETPEARLMRELIEKKRMQRAEHERLEKELQGFDFEEWWEGLSQTDRDTLVEPSGMSQSGSQSQKLLAKQVHAEKFWPDRKQQALNPTKS